MSRLIPIDQLEGYHGNCSGEFYVCMVEGMQLQSKGDLLLEAILLIAKIVLPWQPY